MASNSCTRTDTQILGAYETEVRPSCSFVNTFTRKLCSNPAVFIGTAKHRARAEGHGSQTVAFACVQCLNSLKRAGYPSRCHICGHMYSHWTDVIDDLHAI